MPAAWKARAPAIVSTIKASARTAARVGRRHSRREPTASTESSAIDVIQITFAAITKPARTINASPNMKAPK